MKLELDIRAKFWTGGNIRLRMINIEGTLLLNERLCEWDRKGVHCGSFLEHCNITGNQDLVPEQAAERQCKYVDIYRPVVS